MAPSDEDVVVCVTCSTRSSAVARFCYRCGGVLQQYRERSRHYAAQPTESVRALVLVSTLMPHLSTHRHHVYRVGMAAAVGAAMVAAGFGILPVALICAGVALPGMLLTYFYDHEIWSDEPAIVLGLSVGLAGGLGVALGLIANHFSNSGLLVGVYRSLPSLRQLLNESLLLPLAALVLLLIPPALMTFRPKFRHALDAITIAALGGAAYSLGETLVIQHGAFSSLTVQGTDAARDAFTALTLGFVKPVIYATASSFALLRFRRRRNAQVWGVVISYLLIAVYDAADVALSNYGQQGVVLTFLVAVVLAVAGLRLVRNEAHRKLLDEAAEAAGVELAQEPVVQCPNCQLEVPSGANFCLACGTAVAAMPKQLQAVLSARGQPGPTPGGDTHRMLHGKLTERTVGALAGVGILVVGGFVGLLVLTGQSAPTTSLPGVPLTANQNGAGGQVGSPIGLGDNLYVTPQAGWVNSCTGNCGDEAHLVSPQATTVAVFAGAQPFSADATSELVTWQQSVSAGQSALFSRIKTGTVTTNALPANQAGVTSLAYESLAGVISTNQGTVQVYGVLAVYLNVPGHYAVREYYYARSSDQVRLEVTAINAMENSILAS
ncbi:MAG TPA: zinc ribbon domain-containing protein [Acidimicrobiales bacterium]|nr:zinc ribbon domain-containing protein [Acidimicrobiales bacterium]